MQDYRQNSAGFDAQQSSYFKIYLITRLLTVFIFITMAIRRLIVYCTRMNLIERTDSFFWVSFPLLLILVLIIITQYVIYRRIGPRIFKYSTLIDFAFTVVFVGDWVLLLHHQLQMTAGGYRYDLATIVSLLGFSWRTLIQVLMARHWILKIIPTTCAYIYILSFAVVHERDKATYILLLGILQALYVIVIFYFEHRLNFRLMIGNLQQEQWLQLNEFILNSIPENIVIMDFDGKCQFISEHFKKLIMLRNHSLETKEFFKKITNLQRQPQIDDAREAGDKSCKDFVALETHLHSPAKDDTSEIESLEYLIAHFKNLITQDMIKNKSLHVFNGKFKQDNLEERSFEINLSFIDHQFNKHILLILRDTTERDLILTLQGNIKYKDHLLHSISHELRTPLNCNINLIQTAINSNNTRDQIKDDLLVPALKCSKFLLHMINDILDMSQVKVYQLHLVFQQSNIKETLVNAFQLLEFSAKKKNLTLEIEIDNDIPDLFCTDHNRLSQIVVNLMNNAIKTTQKGFVKLSALSLKDTNQIQICIEDSGAGMTEESTKNLFKDFTQIEHKNRENLNLASFATGLKITNDLAELLGPKDKKGITVTSICNQGTKFSFIVENKETRSGSQNKIEPEGNHKEEQSPTVPNETCPEKDLSLTSKIERNTISNLSRINLARSDNPSSLNLHFSCSCAKVLVVDDDPFNIMAYEVILNSISVKYECAYSGQNAIEKMLNKAKNPCSSHCQPYRLVFMDEEMPGLTGTQTVAEIQSLQKQDQLPQMNIIGCSAHHEAEEIEKFMKSGIAEFIPKPISKNIIKKMIDKYGS